MIDECLSGFVFTCSRKFESSQLRLLILLYNIRLLNIVAVLTKNEAENHLGDMLPSPNLHDALPLHLAGHLFGAVVQPFRHQHVERGYDKQRYHVENQCFGHDVGLLVCGRGRAVWKRGTNNDRSRVVRCGHIRQVGKHTVRNRKDYRD